MTPIQQIKENPIIAVLVALLIAAVGILGGMNHFSLETIQTNQRESDRKMWEKLDRVTALMTREADRFDIRLSDVQKVVVCHDKDIAKITERIENHISEWERTRNNGGRERK